MNTPLERLRHHVSGAIERGEAEAIVSKDYDLGDRVFWTDPNDGLCSGNGTVTNVWDDVVVLDMDGGSEVEAFMRELGPVK